jgi:hypothetical protein
VRVILDADSQAKDLATFYGLKFSTVSSVAEIKDINSILIVADPAKVPDYQAIEQFVKQGGKALLLNNRQRVVDLLPDHVKGYKAYRHEIVTMNVKEYILFDGLEPLDMAWFTDGREVPYVAHGRFAVDRFSPEVTALAETLEWHGYLQKPSDYKGRGGVPLFEVSLGKGKILVSELRVDAVSFDPINGRIIGNLLNYEFE